MKKHFYSHLSVVAVAVILVVSIAYQALAVGPKVSEPKNPHNLSAANTISGFQYKATNDAANNPRGQQICVFCHTPHNSNVESQGPLWNRKPSAETSFQRYSSSTLKIRGEVSAALYGTGAQPNGSTKLCLSCHDGSSRLGDVYTGGEIAMVKSVIDINGISSFNNSSNKMKSGHHPVSFVYTAEIGRAIESARGLTADNSTYKMPSLSAVKLDKQSRMQCTTCHDAHQNMTDDTVCYGGPCDSTFTQKVAPFWVLGTSGVAATDQQSVCTTCHPMVAGPWP